MTTSTEGAGHGCTCVARSARACHLILGAFPMAPNQKCECLCHTWCEDDEPRGRWPRSIACAARRLPMFDEQPDGDPHGECAAEIARLTAELKEARQDLRIHEGINVERDARLVQAEERIRYLTMDLEEKERPLDAQMARLNANLIAANEKVIFLDREYGRVCKELNPVRAEVERLRSVLSDERIARHALKAGECPPDSVVVLVSSMRRLAALQEPTL